MNEQTVLVFSGRVHPERAGVTLTGLPPLKLQIGGHVVQVALTIASSQVTFRLVGELDLDLPTLKNNVQGIVAMTVDAIGWGNGCGYTIEITSWNGENDAGTFGVDIPVLKRDQPESLADAIGVIKLLLGDSEGKLKPLRRALADFRMAMLSADDTPFYCFRAIESLMFCFGRNTKKGRRELCRCLRIDDNWIRKNLEIPAAEVRHGKIVEVSDNDRQIAFLSARTVIERFITLVSRGVEQLPEAEFSLARNND
jgi:hypothetical protein